MTRSPCTLSPPVEGGGCLVTKRPRVDIGMIKIDNPSASVHGEADGAVHTYAFGIFRRESRERGEVL